MLSRAKSREVTIRSADDAEEVFLGDDFRVDHPFRATRMNFGANVLDSEGEVHQRKKREWSRTFSRANVASDVYQSIMKESFDKGFSYAMAMNDLYLIATYFPTKVILDLVGCGHIDPMEHNRKVQPLIKYLETNVKPEGLQQAREYIRESCFYDNGLFDKLPGKERENDISMLVGAGAETTIVAMEIMLVKWADDPERFCDSVRKLGVEQFVVEMLDSDPPLGLATKFCYRDTILAGENISKGDVVHVSVVDANRGAVCPMKKAKGVVGKVRSWLTFGLGRHRCPGHLLAKAELAMLVELLLSLDVNGFNIVRSEEDARPVNFRHPAPYKIEPKGVV